MLTQKSTKITKDMSIAVFVLCHMFVSDIYLQYLSMINAHQLSMINAHLESLPW